MVFRKMTVSGRYIVTSPNEFRPGEQTNNLGVCPPRAQPAARLMAAWPDIDQGGASAGLWPDIDDKTLWPEIDEAWLILDKLIASEQSVVEEASKARWLETKLSELLKQTDEALGPLSATTSAYTLERLKGAAKVRVLQISSKAVGDMMAARMEAVDAADSILRDAGCNEDGATAALRTPRGVLLGQLEALRIAEEATRAQLVENARFELMLAVDELVAEADLVCMMSNGAARSSTGRFLSVLTAATIAANTAARIAASRSDASQNELRSSMTALVEEAADLVAWTREKWCPSIGSDPQLTSGQLDLKARLAASRLARPTSGAATPVAAVSWQGPGWEAAATGQRALNDVSVRPDGTSPARSVIERDEPARSGAAATHLEIQAGASIKEDPFLRVIESSASARHEMDGVTAASSAEGTRTPTLTKNGQREPCSGSPEAVEALRAIVFRLQDLNLEVSLESLHAAGLIDGRLSNELEARCRSRDDSDFDV